MEIINNILSFIGDNGARGVVVVIIVILLIILFRFCWLYMPHLVKKLAIKTEQKKIKERQKADILVHEKLEKLLLNSKADRASIVEFHNGKENLTGLPFRYGTFSYEITRDDVDKVGDKYDSLNLSRYKAPMYFIKNKFFIGTVDEFKKIDKTMASYLVEDNVKYTCILLLRQHDINIGLLMLSYNEKDESLTKEKIAATISQYVQEISSLLTLKTKKQ